MNKNIREENIRKIVQREKDDPFGKQEIPWKDDLVTMNVYKIPLDLLIYNKFNGRILSRTKSLERQNHAICVETPVGKNLIEKLLWDSKPERNKSTLKSIAYYGQQKVGIITSDGVIIDGNRRVMMLNRIMNGQSFTKKFNYFKAVVLPVRSDENPLAIQELETKFQMGEDEKLGYNATEKYLRAKEIYLSLAISKAFQVDEFEDQALNTISDWMGETKTEIVRYLNAMIIMEEYLSYLDYDGIYTQLDGREDQFLSLTKSLRAFYNIESLKGFDGYSNDNVDDLKVIAFDFIRLRGNSNFDGKEFRNLAEGRSDKHFFGDRMIWTSFSEKHFGIFEKLPDESEIDYDSSDLNSHLNARDQDFFNNSKFGKTESLFLENLNSHKRLVGFNKASEEPGKLVKRATQTFEAIKTNHTAFATPEVQEQVKVLGNKIFQSLQRKSPSSVLDHIIQLLKSIDVDEIPELEIGEIKKQLKEIQALGYKKHKAL